MARTRFYFLRHPELVENTEGLIASPDSLNFTPMGLQQKQFAAARLSHEEFDILYSSDHDRCYVFAKEIQEQNIHAPQIKSLDLLRERDPGSLVNTSTKNLVDLAVDGGLDVFVDLHREPIGEGGNGGKRGLGFCFCVLRFLDS